MLVASHAARCVACHGVRSHADGPAGAVPLRRELRTLTYSAVISRARVVGYALHFVFGLLFSLAYYAAFLALGRSGWATFGLLHSLFAGTTVHPRMGTSMSAADSAPLLESPGFLLLNYGRATPTVTILAHLTYGAIVGVFAGGGAG